MSVTLGVVPHYIKSNNPENLRLEMLKTCLRDGYKYTFTDIQYVNGKWFAWYEKPANEVSNKPRLKDGFERRS